MTEIQEQSRHAVISAKKTYWKNNAAADVPPMSPEDTTPRSNCDADLRVFLQTCFPNVFPLAFSSTHDRMISEIQRAVDSGGLKAIAAPRGSGKTSILLRAAMWAILTGRRRYCCIVAADEMSAVSNLSTIKTEYLSAVAPIEALGINVPRTAMGGLRQIQ